MTPADTKLVEKVRSLMAPVKDGSSWLERACLSADTSAQLTKMRYEMGRVILTQATEIARLREALEPFAAFATHCEAVWRGHADETYYTSCLRYGDLRRARAEMETKP